jgi:hypothetical protein
MILVRCKSLTRLLGILKFLRRWSLRHRIALWVITDVSEEPDASIFIAYTYRLLGRCRQEYPVVRDRSVNQKQWLWTCDGHIGLERVSVLRNTVFPLPQISAFRTSAQTRDCLVVCLSICTPLLHVFMYVCMNNRSHRKTARSKPSSWGFIRLPQFRSPVFSFWLKLYSAAFHIVIDYFCSVDNKKISSILFWKVLSSHTWYRDQCSSGLYWSMKLSNFYLLNQRVSVFDRLWSITIVGTFRLRKDRYFRSAVGSMWSVTYYLLFFIYLLFITYLLCKCVTLQLYLRHWPWCLFIADVNLLLQISYCNVQGHDILFFW